MISKELKFKIFEFIIKELEGEEVTIDTGGLTRFGITFSAYKKYKTSATEEELKNIKFEDTIDFYEKEYWIKGKCDKIKYPLCFVHYDGCINAGIKASSKYLQTVLVSCGQDIKVDGIIGTKTLNALNTIEENSETLTNMYLQLRLEHYSYLAEIKKTKVVNGIVMHYKNYYLGWLNRISKVKKFIENNSISV